MARDKMAEERAAGMEFALKIAKERGIEGLEQEIRYRNMHALKAFIPSKELQEAKTKITERSIDIISLIGLMVLRDEFGFGQQRGKRWLDRFLEKTKCLFDDSPGIRNAVTIEDYQKVILDEMGIRINVSEGLR